MTRESLVSYVLPHAFSLLPVEMGSERAAAMLLAIGWQESKFEVRRQFGGGPAMGFWQFEQRGGVRGVLRHEATSGLLKVIWARMGYLGSPSEFGVWQALEHNDVLAAVCARLLLWTAPGPLPQADEPAVGWAQYLAAWRPGRPRPEAWAGAWDFGWEPFLGHGR